MLFIQNIQLVSVEQLHMEAMIDAQYRSTQAAVLDQEMAEIDVITGGEMHRRTHNRHSPSNAMRIFSGRTFLPFKAQLGQNRSPNMIPMSSILLRHAEARLPTTSTSVW